MYATISMGRTGFFFFSSWLLLWLLLRLLWLLLWLLRLLWLLVVAVVLQRLDVEEQLLHVLLHLLVLVAESRHLLPERRVLALQERGSQRDLAGKKKWARFKSVVTKSSNW